MITGYDIQRWYRCKELAKEANVELEVIGDAFQVTAKKPRTSLGRIPSLEGLFNYLCGYTAGIAKIKG